MSIIIARQKDRVTRPKGYRLNLGDGLVRANDEVMGKLERTPGGWYGPRDHLADFQARRSTAPVIRHVAHMERVLTHDSVAADPTTGFVDGTLVPVTRDGSPRKNRGWSKKSVDAYIRATGFTGPISKQIRDLARDVISHQNSVAAYVADN